MKAVGRRVFVGIALVAVIGGVLTDLVWVDLALIAVGVVMGAVGVAVSDAQRFLVPAIGLVLSGNAFTGIPYLALRGVPYVGVYVTRALDSVVTIVSAAVVVVALRLLCVVLNPGPEKKGSEMESL